jgi:hypothetical protein
VAILANIARWLLVCSNLKQSERLKKATISVFAVLTVLTVASGAIYFFRVNNPAFLANLSFVYYMYVITLLPIILYLMVYYNLKKTFLGIMCHQPSERDIRVIDEALKTTRFFFIIIC